MSYPQHTLLQQLTEITQPLALPAAYRYEEKVKDFLIILTFFLNEDFDGLQYYSSLPFLELEAHN